MQPALIICIFISKCNAFDIFMFIENFWRQNIGMSSDVVKRCINRYY